MDNEWLMHDLGKTHMNERIKELAEQVYGSAHYDDFKFAELIVAECVHTVQNRGGMCGALASNWIKEHFGVEE